MKFIKLLMGVTVLATANVNASLYRTTVHSRANCLNNESITWWNNHAFDWKVISIHKHRPTKQMCFIDTGFNFKDRVAAIHWGEGVHGGFLVWGYHYYSGYSKSVPFDSTYAEGCNIIDGWIER